MKTTAPVTYSSVHKIVNEDNLIQEDLLAVEEPLQIKIQWEQNNSWKEKELAITMRTPGNDFELAMGFLLAENIIQTAEEVLLIRYCKRVKTEERGNVLLVRLHPAVQFDFSLLDRNFYTHSSCGVCGKSSIASIQCNSISLSTLPEQQVLTSTLLELNKSLLKVQTGFKYTGGLHAAALYSLDGNLLLIKEDVGRHNAMDKVVGAALQQGMFPLHQQMVLLSGRVSFEMVQKAIRAGIPVLAAVGAPSSLAVALAAEKGLTLIGFLRENRFNIYTHAQRIR